MRDRRVIVALAIICIAIISALFFARYFMGSKGGPDEEKAGAASEEAVSFSWREGAGQMYRFVTESDVSSFQTSQSAVQKIRAEGVLNFRIFSIENGNVKAGFQLSPFSLTVSGKNDAGLSGLHSVFFLASIDISGEMKEFYFPGDMAAEDRDAVAENIRALQFILPHGAIKEWEEKERHANGEYSSIYRLTDDGNVLKSKSGYLAAGTPGMFKTDVIYSRIIAEIDDAYSWIKNLSGVETLEVKNAEGKAVIKTDSRIELKSLPFVPDMDIDIWKEKRSFDLIKASFEKKMPPKLSFHQKRRSDSARNYFLEKGIKFEDIMHRIKSNLSERQNKEEMIEFLKLFPEEASKFQGMFLSSGDGDLKNVIFNLLKLAGTEQAQVVITNVMAGEEYGEADRLHAIFTISGLTEPTAGTVRAIWQCYEDRSGPDYFSSSYLLAIGALSGRLGKDVGDPQKKLLSEEINRRLSEELITARTSEEKYLFIGAIGNASDLSFLPQIAPFLKSSEADLRGAAANALRGMDVPEVTDMLADAISAEGESSVREKIITSLLSLSVSSKAMKTIQKQAVSEGSADVRRGMIQYLSKNIDKYPENKALLKNILSNETDKKSIRLIIKNTRD